MPRDGTTSGSRASSSRPARWKTGETLWRERGFHKAQALYADGGLLFLDEAGQLVLGRVTPERFELLDQARVTESVSWTLPTLVSTTLYLRDRKNILALDLSESAGRAAAAPTLSPE